MFNRATGWYIQFMFKRFIHFSLSFTLAGGIAGAAEPSGQWPRRSQIIVTEQNLAEPSWAGIRDPYLITLVDQLKLKARGWGRLIPGSQIVRVLNRSPEFLTADGEFSGLRVHHWPAAPGRDLAVYLPGIFQGAVDEDSSRVVFTLREAGYHVVVLPNPLSAEYFRNSPVAPPHALAREAGVVAAAIEELATRLGAARVRVLAASYGAALGARAWAHDQESARPRIEDLTLLFPQFDLARSLALVDATIAAPRLSQAPRAAIGAAYARSLARLVARLRRRYAEDLRAGFKARRYPPVAAAHLTEQRPAPSRLDLHEVMRHFVASDEVSNIYRVGESRLTHWLERGFAARGNDHVRLITARDDWTNDPDVWDHLPTWLSGPAHSLILVRAGHAGVVAREWFRRVVLEAMRP